MEPFVDITHADGRRDRHVLDAERTTLGAGPSATVRLDGVPGLAAEHVLLVPQGNSCWISTPPGATPPVLVDGQPFESGLLSWGTELSIGPVRVAIAAGGAQDAGEDSAKLDDESASKPSPILLIAAVAALGWVTVTMLSGGETTDHGIHAAPPDPFVSDATVCDNLDNPIHAANTAVEYAEAKSQRYPFDPQDGVSAAALYREAASCYREAGRDRPAAAADRDADEVERRLRADYRAAQLRLDRALDRADTQAAQREVYLLVDMIAHQGDTEYLLELRSLQRRLHHQENPQ